MNLDPTVLAILAATAVVAFANGANDNFKGVATLYGSGRCGYRAALSWATATTVAGSALALALGAALAAKFTGRGLVPDEIVTAPRFGIAVGLATAATVLLATRLGLPISTTHALVGALLGAGLATVPAEVRFAAVGQSFVLPLLASPVIALALTATVYLAAARLRRASGLRAESCICVGALDAAPASTSLAGAAGAPAMAAMPAVPAAPAVIASRTGCDARPRWRGVTARQALDLGHFASAGAVGFARGLNDAPKIMALAATVPAASGGAALTLVAAAMAIGGWIGARPVAERISRGVTTMNEGQGFVANVVTAAMVCGATIAALPVSTTHVSVGALFGIGAANRAARRAAIASITVAWVVTLPLAALLAAGTAWALD